MHQLRKSFTQNTQILRKYIYAVITQLSPFTQLYYAEITQKLRRNKLRNDYAFYAIITQMNYADIPSYTQINYANHYAAFYADYAIITQFNYANTITQFLKNSLRRLRKYRFQLRRNSGHYAMGKLAEVQVLVNAGPEHPNPSRFHHDQPEDHDVVPMYYSVHTASGPSTGTQASPPAAAPFQGKYKYSG